MAFLRRIIRPSNPTKKNTLSEPTAGTEKEIERQVNEITKKTETLSTSDFEVATFALS